MGESENQKVMDEFESNTKDAERVQKETLRRILEENGEAEYLLKRGLAGRTDPDSFKSCVPLVDHKDIAPYIQRIADGDDSPILTGKPITSISLSSGTTEGRPKFVPFNEELVNNTMQVYRTSFAFRNREFPIENGRALQFIFGSKQFMTKGGIPAGTATTNVFRSEQFKSTMRDIQSQCCSPEEVIFGADFRQSLYCHLLCGLIYWEEVQFVSSTFAHTIVRAFQTFEQVWGEIVTDLRNGVLSNSITIPSIRSAVSKILKPSPELAASVQRKCSALSNWYGLIPELWPNAKYVYGVMTGSMEPYLKKLRHYSGGLPLLSADYGSSEGWVGVNVYPRLAPELTTYVVLPDIGYFEFVPCQAEEHTSDPETNPSTAAFMETEPLGLTEVKVGEEYELVVTNFAGLYRYRLGDIVKVMGFHNSTPELQFVCRKSLILTINIDKNTEKDLQLAVEAASTLLTQGVEIIDYTSHIEMSSGPGHYVIFWELSGEADDNILIECSNCLDRSFIDAGYVSSRKSHMIGPLELMVVRRGTFHKILDHYLGLGGAVSQFKTPRHIGAFNHKVLQILYNNVIKSFFSIAFG